jgi:SAM-dependent methyltransferase
MSTTLTRGPYQGVVQILQFNRRMYAATTATLMVCWLAAALLPVAGRIALLIASAPAAFWLATSLAVSHYVYDRFPLYDLRWLERALLRMPRRWLNVHSGWDETSELLASVFPGAEGNAADIFDAQVMTEASIRRAHRMNRSTLKAKPARYDELPFDSGSFDAAFAIFAAHELRRHDQRVQLFREIARVLAPGGELVLIEHARDWGNFLAFGPGFLHFFSPHAWRSVARGAGLMVRAEFRMTRFVRVYLLMRPK